MYKDALRSGCNTSVNYRKTQIGFVTAKAGAGYGRIWEIGSDWGLNLILYICTKTGKAHYVLFIEA